MWDYIIVGAGSAGCVLANRLSEDPGARVLLLEAGGRDWNPLIHVPAGVRFLYAAGPNWGFRTVPQKHLDNRRIWYPQGKTLGGSSSINAMIYIRCQKEDYDHWAALGNDGWSYDDVLPYFRKSEDNDGISDRYHGRGGPLCVSNQAQPHQLTLSFLRAMQQLGLPSNPDFNGDSMYGAGLYQTTCRNGLRQSAAVAYLHPARRRPNLVVRTRTRVLRVLIEKGRATGVQLASGRAVETVHASGEVIVSAGPVNSPRLLLLSGIGPADGLKAIGIEPVMAIQGVGRHLQDHLSTSVHVKLKRRVDYDAQSPRSGAMKDIIRWMRHRDGPVSAMLVEGGGFFQTEGATRPDLQIHMLPTTVIHAGLRQLWEHGFMVNSTYLRPKSEGSVRLGSADPAAEPLVDPNYLDDGYDRAMALKSVRMIREVLAQSEMTKYAAVERLPGLDIHSDDDIMGYIRRYSTCDFHPVGTCRMGIDDGAVVDPDLRVRGIEGMRVIDSSIMPTLISGNTNGPTMMIGEKGADLVKGIRRATA